MHIRQSLSLLLLVCCVISTAPPSAFSAGKTVSGKTAASRSVLTAKRPVKQANPLVPYTYANEQKAVMIPQSLATALKLPSQILPVDSDLMRTTAWPLQQIAETPNLNGPFTQDSQVLAILNQHDQLPTHMEALRRGYTELPETARKDLLVRLLKRYEQSPEDPIRYFDYGYAQLVYLNNQTGLFFLRKANERLQNQFTALVYAMGQAQVDLNQEKALPEEMNARKQDVVHKMQDALERDVKAHHPGFWPAYVQVVQKLSRLSAYEDFTRRDFSLSYIPAGKKPLWSQSASPAVILHQAEAIAMLGKASGKTEKRKIKIKKDEPKTKLKTDRDKSTEPVIPPVAVRAIPNSAKHLEFYETPVPNQFQVKVVDAEGRQELAFFSHGGLDLVEDLEQDGAFELVVRQYRAAPFEPVIVYRLKDGAFELDQSVSQYFL